MDLPALKKHRGVEKANITRANTFAKSDDAKTASKSTLKNRRILAEQSFQRFEDFQQKIEEKCQDDDELNAQLAQREETENRYIETVSTLDELLESQVNNEGVQPAQPAAVTSVKLPTLDIPSFSGRYEEWSSFHDLFSAIVHTNTRLTGAQKLQYLKKALTADASGLLRSMPVTDANYTEAWQILSDRYDNKRQIIYAHLKTLFSQQVMSNESSPELRKLLDTTIECVRALKALDRPVNHWDDILVHILAIKLDPQSREKWESHPIAGELPTYEEITSFMEGRCRILEALNSSRSKKPPQGHKAAIGAHFINTSYSCAICNESHSIYQCKKFETMSPGDRLTAVKKKSLCTNCLKSGHGPSQCNSGTCRKCKGKHHTLLHRDTPNQSQQTSNPTPPEGGGIYCKLTHSPNLSILSTAIILIEDSNGEMQEARALLDSGSESSFITEACFQRLRLPCIPANIPIHGVGSVPVGRTKGLVNLIIKSTADTSFAAVVATYITPKIAGCQPSRYITDTGGKWSHLTNITLADPTYYIPDDIDVLLGNDIFAELILPDKIICKTGGPNAMNTVFGWILSGKTSTSTVLTCALTIACHVSTIEETIDNQLRKFWEIEEVSTSIPQTDEEKSCEMHFENTTTIDESTGRFITRLPFKDATTNAGNSREVAIRRLKLMERKLVGKPEYRREYNKFMTEYRELGHMKLIPSEQINKSGSIYLPHHFVLKESSTTTKFRVVFDASAKVSGGKSLNSNLMVGPKIQDDLITLLIRFRIHKVAVTADIAKMYRQILVHPDDVDYLRIVWRDSENQPIQHYQLLTVTYGTASAPYTAQKCLQVLAKEHSSTHPSAALVLEKDFYMDDLMSGSNDTDNAIKLANDLITILDSRGMPLRKWSSNEPAVLQALPEELRETQVPLSISPDDSIKTLGIVWHPALDYFTFKVSVPQIDPTAIITKRKILSETAQLFDPLGWLGPIILIPKIILQKLWIQGVGWDDALAGDISTEWINFRQQLPAIESIRLPRFMGEISNTTQLHGFADASEKAYGAVVYIKNENDDNVSIHLIASKTRVAPVKQVSLPRLELCAAVLLTRLMNSVLKSFSVNKNNIFMWSDSTVTLCWLRDLPNRWKTFVANRVSEIQSSFPSSHWGHVSGVNNPADLASRGVQPSDLHNNRLWWNGPWWLSSDQPNFTTHTQVQEEDIVVEEQRKISSFNIALAITSDHIMMRFSDLQTLNRITAWCWRFIVNCKIQMERRKGYANCAPNKGVLSLFEIKSSLYLLIKLVQSDVFHGEVQCCTSNTELPHRSKLSGLQPFLDANGVLRVGGRLKNANISYDRKFPIVLPKSHKLTELIVTQCHLKHLHAGAQLMLTLLQREYWILGSRHVIKKQIHRCNPCFRQRASISQQVMADLPRMRVEPSFPFSRVGVDYAGPVYVKALRARGQRVLKAYIALFVCMSTRAIHLELVEDMTTAAFIAALERLTSLRGICNEIFSDCGSNFIGAKRELSELRRLLISQQHNELVAKALEKDGIMWTMIPPGAPHFGGFWEAGIKSTKHHLIRVVGKNVLTFKEMETLLCKISACLNSRPLTALSSDPNDLQALTPGHFLVGRPMKAIPQPDVTHLKENRLDKWQLMQRINQDFWRRWSTEFLTRLQQRPKWNKKTSNFKINDIVLIRDERLPPLKWLLGRIIQIHPDKNNIVRVCTVKTENGVLTRPIVKLSLLPFNDNVN